MKENFTLQKIQEYLVQFRREFSFVENDISFKLERYIELVVLEGDTPRELALAVLSQCDHVVMSVGTFGWWAAMLAQLHRSESSYDRWSQATASNSGSVVEGEASTDTVNTANRRSLVTYYKTAVRPRSKLSTLFSYRDYFPPDWIALSD